MVSFSTGVRVSFLSFDGKKRIKIDLSFYHSMFYRMYGKKTCRPLFSEGHTAILPNTKNSRQ